MELYIGDKAAPMFLINHEGLAWLLVIALCYVILRTIAFVVKDYRTPDDYDIFE